MNSCPLGETALSSRYHIIGGVGQGYYGTVFKALDRSTGRPVAIKKTHILHLSEGLPKSFYRELTALQCLSDDNIVKYVELVKDDDYTCYIVLEYCEFDLAALIRMGGPLDVTHTRWYMNQLFRALILCHSNNIAHRDIKPANVFVTRDNTIKLGDFGLARMLPSVEKKLTRNIITICYKPPETILGDDQYDTSVDVWSLGCLIYECITGRVLFNPKSVSDSDQIAAIYDLCGTPNESECPRLCGLPYYSIMSPKQQIRSRLHDHLLSTIPPEFVNVIDLIEQMLSLEPSKRPTVEQCFAHPFFASDDLVHPPPLAFPECHAADFIYAKAKVNKKIEKISAKALPVLNSASLIPIDA